MGQVSNVVNFAKVPNPFLPVPPVLKMSKRHIHQQAQLFISQFPGETSYAVKANSERPVVAELVKAGITTFDVASLHEMELVKSILPTAKLHYHNPVRSREEVGIALNLYDCKRFSVDHLDSLNEIYQQAADPRAIEIAIRFRMETKSEAVQSFKSKFGVLRDEAFILLNAAYEMGFKTGLTFHPGSQTTSPAPYLEHIEEASFINGQANHDISFLNIGGGLPSSYQMIKTDSLSVFFHKIGESFQEHFNSSLIKLECEPGRALVAGAGTLVTRIKNARHDRQELFLNDGIYGGLMEFHQFPELFPHYESTSITSLKNLIKWTVYGPTCDPIDVLPYPLILPANLLEGNEIEFKGVGAYSTATATRFNGYGAIEVQMV